jgi:VTC domain
MKFRHELKHLINYRDHALIRLKLQSLLAFDANVDPGGSYMVRSLYFDDYYNHAYNDKYAGVQNRTKYRIRIYNNSDKTINLEKKTKRVSYNYKQTAPLTKEQVMGILDGNYEVLLGSSNNLLDVFYHECVSNVMRPRVIVDYEREPYIMEAGDVRITFDKHIRAGSDNFDIFDPDLPTMEVMNPGLLVLEVKFTEFLPNILRKILPLNTSAEYDAVSKFILCCDKTNRFRLSHY